jgi:hypothetical protein
MKGLAAAMMDKESSKEDDGEETEQPTSFDEYADDCLDAMKSGNRKAFRTALHKAIQSCYGEGE